MHVGSGCSLFGAALIAERLQGFNELDSSVLSDSVANTEKLGGTVQTTQLLYGRRRRRRRRFRRWRGRIRRRRRRARRAPCRCLMHVKFMLVGVHVSVRRIGKGVRLGKCRGRSNADIVVLQVSFSFEPFEQPDLRASADDALLQDASGSVNSLEWSQQQCFTKGLINSLPLGSTGGRMGIATFAYRSKTVCSMTSSKYCPTSPSQHAVAQRFPLLSSSLSYKSLYLQELPRAISALIAGASSSARRMLRVPVSAAVPGRLVVCVSRRRSSRGLAARETRSLSCSPTATLTSRGGAPRGTLQECTSSSAERSRPSATCSPSRFVCSTEDACSLEHASFGLSFCRAQNSAGDMYGCA